MLLRCCVNLLDFYRRCGVADRIQFFDKLYFVRPGGAVDVLKRGILPAPLHLFGSMARFKALDWGEKVRLIRTLLEIRRERHRGDLDSTTMADWLASKGESRRAIDRFWRPILVSALNEEPERASALPAFQVFWQGMMQTSDGFEMGVPAVPLAELYSAAIETGLGAGVHVHLRSPIERIDPQDASADFYVLAVPFERVDALLPGLGARLERFEHSPITGIHLWFERPITYLPHAVLLDRTIQWMFRKSDTYIQAVVSASRHLVPMSKSEIVSLAHRELGDFFPNAGRVKIERAHVVKELRATYSAVPGLEQDRPQTATRHPNVFLAGDWTASGWPATMEGAVRSGYLAAEAVARAAGREARFLLP